MSKTSIEWYEQRLYDIEFAFTQGVFDNKEYQIRKLEAFDQAKEVHKQECVRLLNHHNDIFDTSEEHYNKTFGGNK